MAWYGPRGNCGCCGDCPFDPCNPDRTNIESIIAEVEIDDEFIFGGNRISGLGAANGTYDMFYDSELQSWQLPVIPISITSEFGGQSPQLSTWYYSVGQGVLFAEERHPPFYLPVVSYGLFIAPLLGWTFSLKWIGPACSPHEDIVCSGNVDDGEIGECLESATYPDPVPGYSFQFHWPSCWQWFMFNKTTSNSTVLPSVYHHPNGEYTSTAFNSLCYTPSQGEKELILTSPDSEFSWRAWTKITHTREPA